MDGWLSTSSGHLHARAETRNPQSEPLPTVYSDTACAVRASAAPSLNLDTLGGAFNKSLPRILKHDRTELDGLTRRINVRQACHPAPEPIVSAPQSPFSNTSEPRSQPYGVPVSLTFGSFDPSAVTLRSYHIVPSGRRPEHPYNAIRSSLRRPKYLPLVSLSCQFSARPLLTRRSLPKEAMFCLVSQNPAPQAAPSGSASEPS